MARQPGQVLLRHVTPTAGHLDHQYALQVNNILDAIASDAVCICTDEEMRRDRCEYSPHDEEWFEQANGQLGMNGQQATYNRLHFTATQDGLLGPNEVKRTHGKILVPYQFVTLKRPLCRNEMLSMYPWLITFEGGMSAVSGTP